MWRVVCRVAVEFKRQMHDELIVLFMDGLLYLFITDIFLCEVIAYVQIIVHAI